jgi:hypothetical protein
LGIKYSDEMTLTEWFSFLLLFTFVDFVTTFHCTVNCTMTNKNV